MTEFDHPLSVHYRSKGLQGRGPEAVRLHHRFAYRLKRILVIGILIGLFPLLMATGFCSFDVKTRLCGTARTASPALFGFLALFILPSLARAADPRPYLILDGEGLRFRWAGFIPWSEIAVARGSDMSPRSPNPLRLFYDHTYGYELAEMQAEQFLSDHVFWLEFKDRKALFASLRRNGTIVQKIYFTIQSLPLGLRVFGLQFSRISVRGTGVYAHHLVDWINERVKPGRPTKAVRVKPSWLRVIFTRLTRIP